MPVSDDFTGLASSVELSTRSPWAMRSGKISGETSGGRVCPFSDSLGYSSYQYGFGIFPPDQFAECVIAWGASGSGQMGPAVRMNGVGNGYGALISRGSGVVQMAAFKNGAVLATLGVSSAASGDLVRITAVGTTIAFQVNGVEVFSITDTFWDVGVPGIVSFGATFGIYVDNWSASDMLDDPSRIIQGGDLYL